MDERDWLAEKFEGHRVHLRAVAYRLLGSHAEAEDAVQEAWFRLSRSDVSAVENLGGWLTTVTGRVCLDLLRARKARREDPFDAHVPDPIVSRANGADPEHEAVLADSVGLALLVVLETLTPAERLAFVLHDMFAVPFTDIAAIAGRSPDATKQLASRARRRIQGAAPVSDADVARQREVVDAFLAASRGGDFEGLLAVLDPDVLVRADAGAAPASAVLRGASTVASRALMFARLSPFAQTATVNGLPGVIAIRDGQLLSVMGFVVKHGKIVEIDILADPDRLRAVDLAGLRD